MATGKVGLHSPLHLPSQKESCDPDAKPETLDIEVGEVGTFIQEVDREVPKVHPEIQDMDLQDEELPRALPEGAQSPEDDDDDEEEPAAGGERPAPPTSLPMPGSGRKKKKRLLAPAISLTLERSDSVFSDDYTAAALSPSPDDDDDDDDDTELDINLEDMDTPSDSESFGFPDSPDWEGDFLRFAKTGTGGGTSRLSVTEQAEIGNMELDQVDGDGRRWRRLSISGQECYVNMSVLEPYLQVLSHGGYYGDGLNAIIVFSSCYLPENTIENYQYVMDNLFRYIVGTLELMVSENYVIVYLCGMAPRTKLPNIKWLRQCYMTIDRRLRKNLKGMFFVHPVWYIKVILTIIKPFISTKFSRKVRFIRNLQELSEYIPMEHVHIPDHIRQYDEHMDE